MGPKESDILHTMTKNVLIEKLCLFLEEEKLIGSFYKDTKTHLDSKF